jgi:hypothetical protein
MTTFEVFKWLIALASVAGVVLNIRRLRSCFYVWAVTNAAWAGIDLYHGVWAQAALQAVYLGLAVWGIKAWKK